MKKIEKTVMKQKPKMIILAVIAVALLSLSFVFITSSLNINKTREKSILKYYPELKNNYVVNLKNNSYFTSDTLPEGEEYLTSVIKNIKTNFYYNIDVSDMISGNYKYKIYATIVADHKDESSEKKKVWSKDYELMESKEIPFNKVKNIKFNDSIVITYDDYNEIINNFKKDYMISVSSRLNVFMEVSLNGKYKSKSFNSKVLSSIAIPLSEQTIGIEKDEALKKEYNLTETYVSESKNNIIILVFGIILGLIAIIIIVWQVRKIIIDDKMQSMYLKKKKKYLHDYADLIASVKKIPDIKNLKIIDFENFEELVNAQYDLRVPIIFYESVKNEVGHFYLISQDFAYHYVLKDKK